MVAATIANDGTTMRPYLVAQIKAPDQSTVQSATPATLGRPITSSQASNLTTMMEGVTQNPAAPRIRRPDPRRPDPDRGQDGTAQNGVNNSHLDDAVFTCFAPAATRG